MIRYLVPGRDKAANKALKSAYDSALHDVAERAFQITQEKCDWSDEEKARIHAKLRGIPGVYGADDMTELVAATIGAEVDTKAKPKPNGGAA